MADGVRVARCGRVDDVEEAIRIRTGEEGVDVLQSHEGTELPAG